MLGIPNPIEDEEFEPLEVEEEEARMKHFKIHDDVMPSIVGKYTIHADGAVHYILSN